MSWASAYYVYVFFFLQFIKLFGRFSSWSFIFITQTNITLGGEMRMNYSILFSFYNIVLIKQISKQS